MPFGETPQEDVLERVDAIVVGAGIVGLAVARALALTGREPIIVEAEPAIGVHTSSRNSEVIHAGIYYPANSLKARLCVAGKNMIYEYCRENGVAAQRCGKLIIAVTPAEVQALRALHARATQNGVHELVWLSGEAVAALEPELTASAGLLSLSSGIVDSHALMLALLGEAEGAGAVLALQSKVVAGERQGDGVRLEIVDANGGATQLHCRTLINCAGHGAHEVASSIRGYPAECLPPRFLAKGNYFSVSGRTPFRHLIYPMPVEGGLGVHVTLDLAGRMRLGPDLHWVDRLDYSLDPSLGPQFRDAVARYWPAIRDRELAPSYAGVRPKVSGPGGGDSDFVVQDRHEHGVSGLVNLFGIESPGLTSCLALADWVTKNKSLLANL